jgi:hypothetical protein
VILDNFDCDIKYILKLTNGYREEAEAYRRSEERNLSK